MTYISALRNLNQVVSISGSTTATASAATLIALTLRKWPAIANLQRMTITANNDVAAVTVTVVSDVAQYLAASGNAKAPYVYAVGTGAISNGRMEIDFGNVETLNTQGLDFIGVVIQASSIATGTTFTVTMRGQALQASATTGSYMADNTFRVLQVTTAPLTTDITQNITGRGNPYGIADTDLAQTFPALQSATDYLYIGSTKQFSSLAFYIPGYAKQPAGTTLVAQYWNGSTWATATVYDNTSDQQASPSTMSCSGLLEFNISANSWVLSQVATDPLYVYVQGIISGANPPQTLVACPPRYWVRLQVTSLNGTLNIATLQRIS